MPKRIPRKVLVEVLRGQGGLFAVAIGDTRVMGPDAGPWSVIAEGYVPVDEIRGAMRAARAIRRDEKEGR